MTQSSIELSSRRTGFGRLIEARSSARELYVNAAAAASSTQPDRFATGTVTEERPLSAMAGLDAVLKEKIALRKAAQGAQSHTASGVSRERLSSASEVRPTLRLSRSAVSANPAALRLNKFTSQSSVERTRPVSDASTSPSTPSTRPSTTPIEAPEQTAERTALTRSAASAPRSPATATALREQSTTGGRPVLRVENRTGTQEGRRTEAGAAPNLVPLQPHELLRLSPEQLSKLLSNPEYLKLYERREEQEVGHSILPNGVKQVTFTNRDKTSYIEETWPDGGRARILCDVYGRAIIKDERSKDGKWDITETRYADTADGKPRPWIQKQSVTRWNGTRTETEYDRFGRPCQPVQTVLNIDRQSLT